MTDFLTNFLHALNINKLVNPPIADDLDIPDNTPTNIANGRLNQINRNANADFWDELNERLDQSNKERNHAVFVGSRIAADRQALHKTIQYIHDQLRLGHSVDQVFAKAQEFRRKQYREILQQKAERLANGVKSAPKDESGMAKLLVEDLPVLKGGSYRPGMTRGR